MVGDDVSADAGRRHLCSPATTTSIVSAINKFEGRKFDYRRGTQFEEQYARYSTEQVERIRNDVVMGALRGLSTRLGIAARGTQVDHLRQRGLHRDAAAADARAGRVGAGESDPDGARPRRRRTARARTPASCSPSRISTRGCATSSTPPTATTRPSTRSIRAAWPRSSSGSTTSSGRRQALPPIGARCR